MTVGTHFETPYAPIYRRLEGQSYCHLNIPPISSMRCRGLEPVEFELNFKNGTYDFRRIGKMVPLSIVNTETGEEMEVAETVEDISANIGIRLSDLLIMEVYNI
jgi:hypothetical protein